MSDDKGGLSMGSLLSVIERIAEHFETIDAVSPSGAPPNFGEIGRGLREAVRTISRTGEDPTPARIVIDGLEGANAALAEVKRKLDAAESRPDGAPLPCEHERGSLPFYKIADPGPLQDRCVDCFGIHPDGRPKGHTLRLDAERRPQVASVDAEVDWTDAEINALVQECRPNGTSRDHSIGTIVPMGFEAVQALVTRFARTPSKPSKVQLAERMIQRLTRMAEEGRYQADRVLEEEDSKTRALEQAEKLHIFAEHYESAAQLLQSMLEGEEEKEVYPYCGCDDGTDPDEPADRGFVCEHNPDSASSAAGDDQFEMFLAMKASKDRATRTALSEAQKQSDKEIPHCLTNAVCDGEDDTCCCSCAYCTPQGVDTQIRLPLTHVAVRDSAGRIWSMPAPFRHHHVLKVMFDHGAKQDKEEPASRQGFLDASGRYLTRAQALVHAKANNQIKGGKTIASILTSEDLW